ncbi:hypothetical protein C9374_003004 [Naegleria lovaniensis]|uniref:DNA-directed RNA polymerase III subunit n=1 Tax=Naegleria lovaniensis TaxID=51637 RepID=A0AA88KJP4_NAELO|nr:uncharacterized protein C9374_003004 [Naegleria lovaniensis]KAG2385855.1 hypothetical protein C9374_003004 [Naegleria lovaniensis]
MPPRRRKNVPASNLSVNASGSSRVATAATPIMSTTTPGVTATGDKTSAATPLAKKPPVLSQYQLLAQKKSIAPPLYPTDVTIQKCKPISGSMHHMIEQLRASRLRIRNSPYYIDSQTPSAMDEKKDPLLSALEKLFQQKDDFGEDIDEDENADNLFVEGEEEEEEDADADYTYAHFDDDEDYLDDDDFGGDGGDEGPTM